MTSRIAAVVIFILTACSADTSELPDAVPPDAAPADAAPACRQPTKGVILGDSIAAAMFTQTRDILDATGDEVHSVACAGCTVYQELVAWETSPYHGDPSVGWIVIAELGINDLRIGHTAAAALTDFDILIDAIHGSNPGATVVVGLLLPAHGNINFMTFAYDPGWLTANERLTAEFDGRAQASLALNDGTDCLRAEYDSGDHLHPNLAGLRVLATWVRTWVTESTKPLCP